MRLVRATALLVAAWSSACGAGGRPPPPPPLPPPPREPAVLEFGATNDGFLTLESRGRGRLGAGTLVGVFELERSDGQVDRSDFHILTFDRRCQMCDPIAGAPHSCPDQPECEDVARWQMTLTRLPEPRNQPVYPAGTWRLRVPTIALRCDQPTPSCDPSQVVQVQPAEAEFDDHGFMHDLRSAPVGAPEVKD